MQFQYLFSHKMIHAGGFLWMSAADHNGIYRVDPDTDEVSLMARFPEEGLISPWLYRYSAAYKDRIVFAPYNAKDIAVYNMRDGRVTKIKLDARYAPDIKEKFYAGFLYGESVYFLGCSLSIILKINLETYEQRYFTKWNDRFRDHGSGRLYLSACVVRDGMAYCSFCYSNLVLTIDLADDRMDYILLASAGKGVYGMADDGEDIWITPACGRRLVKWNPLTEQSLGMDIPYSQEDVKFPFHTPVIAGEKIYLFPFFSLKEVFVIDRYTQRIIKDEKFTTILQEKLAGKKKGVMTTSPERLSDGRLAYFNGRDCGWNILDIRTQESQCKYFSLADDDRQALLFAAMENRLKAGAVLSEENTHMLELFLKYIKKGG